MGTISDKLTYLNTTKTKIRKGLNSLGADLDTEDTFRSYADAIDGIYEDYPKITGEGESLSLDNTKQASMQIDYKGNTSQFTTTGKNLFNIEGRYETGTGITYTKNDDGSYILNGTANGNNFLRGLCYLNEQHTISYTSDTANSNVIIRTRTGTPSAQTGIQDQLVVSSTSGNLTSSKQFDFVEISIVNGTTLNNFKIYIQLEKGSSVTPFEPFTNGASPNPSYPQPINVVSGDNTIEICRKNLFDEEIELGNISPSDGSLSSNNSRTRSKNFIKVQPNTTYTMKRSVGSSRWVIGYTKGKVGITDGNFQGYASALTSFGSISQPQQFTTSPTTEYIKWYDTNSTDLEEQVMIIKGNYVVSTMPPYEPYIGHSYPLYLGVENLFDISDITNGGGITNNDNRSITLNGNITSTSYTLTTPFVLKANETYTLSVSNLYPEGGYCTFILRNGSTNVMAVRYSEGYITYTPTQDTTINTLRIFNTGISFNNYTFSVQLEVGSKANHYTPFGQTPIELCKIGTYQDRIFKTTGKNLAQRLPGYLTSGGIFKTSNDDCFYFPVEKGKTYTYNATGNRTLGAIFNSIPTNNDTCIIDTFSNAMQKNTPFVASATGIMVIYANTPTSQTTINTFIAVEGDTIGDYEPYGKGKWYLHKEIGKVILKGTENWTYTSSYPRFTASYSLTDNDLLKTTTTGSLYSNYYIQGETANTNNVISFWTDGTNRQCLIHDERFATKEQLNTWLSSVNVICYGILYTPTNTPITDTTLINQLEESKLSYVNQTNISQVNNDLPFILDVKALRGE